MTTGVVLGNGPSRNFFDYAGDVVIGCNIPCEGFSVDATVITDVEVVWIIGNNPELINCPLILSTTAYEKMKELKIDTAFEIHDVFVPRDWHTSGHYAALYLTNAVECDTINLWGFDSYFVNDASSTTDLILPKSGGVFYKQWRQSWNDIFAAHPKVKYNLMRV